jgi:hypothetical protein
MSTRLILGTVQRRIFMIFKNPYSRVLTENGLRENALCAELIKENITLPAEIIRNGVQVNVNCYAAKEWLKTIGYKWNGENWQKNLQSVNELRELAEKIADFTGKKLYKFEAMDCYCTEEDVSAKIKFGHILKQ